MGANSMPKFKVWFARETATFDIVSADYFLLDYGCLIFVIADDDAASVADDSVIAYPAGSWSKVERMTDGKGYH